MKFYVAVYQADGPENCDKTLVFGEPANTTEQNVSNYSWKWVKLPCPKCNETHMFKRDYWYEALEIGAY